MSFLCLTYFINAYFGVELKTLSKFERHKHNFLLLVYAVNQILLHWTRILQFEIKRYKEKIIYKNGLG